MSTEVIIFIVVASIAGGLTMGGVTWVYFLDKWRVDPEKSSSTPPPSPFAQPGDRRFDEAA